MNDFDKKAQETASRMNDLLKKHGVNVGDTVFEEIKVGAKYCPYGKCFHVWMPKTFSVLIDEAERRFKATDFKVSRHDCKHFARPDIIQLNADF